ncbi:MAG TPA: hypothetical protein VGB59_07400 [Allosphingosinicella sp.]|jgi:hypothetical protein
MFGINRSVEKMPTSIAFAAAIIIAWICGSVLRAVLGEYAKRLWFSCIEPRLLAMWKTWAQKKPALPANAAQQRRLDISDEAEQEGKSGDPAGTVQTPRD